MRPSLKAAAITEERSNIKYAPMHYSFLCIESVQGWLFLTFIHLTTVNKQGRLGRR